MRMLSSMVDVQPLQGIRYVSQAVGDLSQVVAPPYDVTSEEAQARYYARNPYNRIRLQLGRHVPGDTILNNRYTGAATMLAEWRVEDILREDEVARYYCYQ